MADTRANMMYCFLGIIWLGEDDEYSRVQRHEWEEFTTTA